MTSEPIRVLVVDANPSEAGAIPRRTGEVEGIEAVGVAHNRRAAWSLVQSLCSRMSGAPGKGYTTKWPVLVLSMPGPLTRTKHSKCEEEYHD